MRKFEHDLVQGEGQANVFFEWLLAHRTSKARLGLRHKPLDQAVPDPRVFIV